MTNSTISVTELARHFSEYINRALYRDEAFVLTRGKRPVAELRPLPRSRRLADLPGIVAVLPPLGPDESEAFAADLDAAREELAQAEVRDPWES